MRGDFGSVGPLRGSGRRGYDSGENCAGPKYRLGCVSGITHTRHTGGVPAMSNSDGYAFGPKGELGEAGLRRPWATPVVILATKASGTDKLTVSGTFDHFYPVLSTTVGPPS